MYIQSDFNVTPGVLHLQGWSSPCLHCILIKGEQVATNIIVMPVTRW